MLFQDTTKSGVITGFLLQLIQILFVPTFVLPVFWGISQFLYMGPALFWASHRGYTELRKGLWIAAEVCFLLNAICAGLFISGGMRIAG